MQMETGKMRAEIVMTHSPVKIARVRFGSGREAAELGNGCAFFHGALPDMETCGQKITARTARGIRPRQCVRED
jgi:hypothetical protein